MTVGIRSRLGIRSRSNSKGSIGSVKSSDSEVGQNYNPLANTPLSNQQHTAAFEWVHASSKYIPANAVQGGIESSGLPLFIARAYYQDGLHPGKAGSHLPTGAVIGYSWSEVHVLEYQILCGDGSRLRWIRQSGPLDISGFMPLCAGHEKNGDPLYVAKVVYAGSQQIGKCGSHLKGGSSFAYDGKERSATEYMILAYV
ncbi:hypothetical protein GQ54DRAFT_297814 [Martensiomyces pterosporus]|nr:hypothetical protein GQ54DRAFT_297814 [Martensiomyces pterosporus]